MGDMSKAEKEFLLRKHEQTLKLRAEFLKNSSNPFRHAMAEGGTVVSSPTGQRVMSYVKEPTDELTDWQNALFVMWNKFLWFLVIFQFDSGVARFQAMRVNNFEHFKPNGYTFRLGMSVVVLPIILYAWAMKAERAGRERQYRNGEVSYKDRGFKFI